MRTEASVLLTVFALLAMAMAVQASPPEGMIELAGDGGWCWFQSERAVILGDHLVAGCVATGHVNPAQKGDVLAIVYNLKTGKRTIVELHDGLGPDDHNAPGFEKLPNGRLLALYATHGRANAFWYRISAANDPTKWGKVGKFVPTKDSSITYSNVFRLSEEKDRIYNFYRGYANSFKPSYAYSEDGGQTWQSGGVVIRVPGKFRHRPYVKYASDGRRTIHLVYTEGHPRNYDNSLYHIFYRNGDLHRSDGARIAPLQNGLDRPEQGTRIFQGDERNVAWPCDLHLDENGHPVAVYSVQKDPPRLPPRHADSGKDHRYRYARWDGKRWHDFEIAFAGTRLYPGEDDYTGLACLDPDDVITVFISTDAHPVTGKPLISTADEERHYEIFRGVTGDGGKNWMWTAITTNSTVDNLRPIVPKWKSQMTALLWLRGAMRTYTDYALKPVLLIQKNSASP